MCVKIHKNIYIQIGKYANILFLKYSVSQRYCHYLVIASHQLTERNY